MINGVKSMHKVETENLIGNDLTFMWLAIELLVAFTGVVPLICALCINNYFQGIALSFQTFIALTIYFYDLTICG